MRGLPYRVESSEIVSFFQKYGEVTDDDVHIAEIRGKRNGDALAIFESREIA